MVYILLSMYLVICKHNCYTILVVTYAQQLPLIICFVPLIILLFCSVNTFKLNKNIEYYSFKEYIYNSKYNKIFLIFAAIQLYIFWVLIVKSNINFAYDESLWKGFGIEIIKTFTIEEKMLLFDKYYDKFMEALYLQKEHIKGLEEHINIFKTFLSELNFKDLIGEKTTLLEIKNFFSELFEYQYHIYYQQQLPVLNSLQIFLSHIASYVKPYMPFVKNIGVIISLGSFFTQYLDTYYLTNYLAYPRMLKFLQYIAYKIIRKW